MADFDPDSVDRFIRTHRWDSFSDAELLALRNGLTTLRARTFALGSPNASEHRGAWDALHREVCASIDARPSCVLAVTPQVIGRGERPGPRCTAPADDAVHARCSLVEGHAGPHRKMPGGAPFAVGDRVEGGEIAEDHDTGRVVAVEGDRVTVAWDSGVRTTQAASLLRRVGGAS